MISSLPTEINMDRKVLRIGTRESQLAVWQANTVKNLLAENGFESELVYIKSEGDLDLKTPLYEMGVQGIFTRTLDIALLNNNIDIAVHSMKDVPTKLPGGIRQAAILKRASYKDLLVFKGERQEVEEGLGMVNGHWSIVNNAEMVVSQNKRDITQLIPHYSPRTTHHSPLTTHHSPFTIATSSVRRKAQWLNRYPHHHLENLRGNVNTRLRKVEQSNWNGAIFAAAGLERIGLRPENSIELDWMLPAPAQGAIMVVCKENDAFSLEACINFNDEETAFCTQLEKDFLRQLMGGCSTPVSALAQITNGQLTFKGNIFSLDGSLRVDVEKRAEATSSANLGLKAATELLENGGREIFESIHHEKF
jgi:hydroxymethylbilane synthase